MNKMSIEKCISFTITLTFGQLKYISQSPQRSYDVLFYETCRLWHQQEDL